MTYYSLEERRLIDDWSTRLDRLGYLYRYVRLDGEFVKQFEKTVAESEIKFAKVSEFNDAFDGALAFDLAGEPRSVASTWEQFLEDDQVPLDASTQETLRVLQVAAAGGPVQRQLQHRIAQLRSNNGALCMSEQPDIGRMWELYAGSHRGACLRFRSGALRGWDVRCSPPWPMTYAAQHTDVSFYGSSRFGRVRRVLFTKSSDWEYEKEWRVARNEPGTTHLPAHALTGVILGSRVDPKIEERVRAVLSQRGSKLELLRAHVADRDFRLEIRPA